MLKNLLLLIACVGLGVALWLSAAAATVAAGVAIFLFGMLSMEKGFQSFTKGMLRTLLARATQTVCSRPTAT